MSRTQPAQPDLTVRSSRCWTNTPAAGLARDAAKDKAHIDKRPPRRSLFYARGGGQRRRKPSEQTDDVIEPRSGTSAL